VEDEHEHDCTSYSPFHIQIPQLSYSHTLQRYFVARTIPECVALIRARRADSGGEDDYVEEEQRNVLNAQDKDASKRRSRQKKTMMPPLFGWWGHSRKKADTAKEGNLGAEVGELKSDRAGTAWTEAKLQINPTPTGIINKRIRSETRTGI
jgi:hypothetical protein